MRERLLARIGSLAVAQPFAVLAVALLGVALAVVLLPSLEISSSRFELIAEGGESAELGSRRDLVVLVTSRDDASGRAAVDALAVELAERGEVAHVFFRIEPDAWRGRELALMDRERSEALLGALEAREPGAPISLEALVDEARAQLGGDPSVDLEGLGAAPEPEGDERALELLCRVLVDARLFLGDATRTDVSLDVGPEDAPIDSSGYLVSRDQRTRYLFVALEEATDRYDDVVGPVMAARVLASSVGLRASSSSSSTRSPSSTGGSTVAAWRQSERTHDRMSNCLASAPPRKDAA